MGERRIRQTNTSSSTNEPKAQITARSQRAGAVRLRVQIPSGSTPMWPMQSSGNALMSALPSVIKAKNRPGVLLSGDHGNRWEQNKSSSAGGAGIPLPHALRRESASSSSPSRQPWGDQEKPFLRLVLVSTTE